MERKATRPAAVRFGSFLLALVMVLTMLPVTAFAAAPSLKITNSKGEETDTFVVGDPIFVTAESNIAGDWVGLYDSKYPDSSAYWYYVNQDGFTSGETYNIFDHPNGGWEGYHVTAGTHSIKLVESGITKTITIVNPENSSTSLEVEDTSVAYGDPIRIKTTTYTDGAWVAIYSGTHSATETFGTDYLSFYYACGQNGMYKEIELMPGNYTVVLFKDGGYTADKVVNVTVEETDEPIVPLATDKTEYKYGEPIMVTTNYVGSGAWVGLYKKGETYNPDVAGGSRSIFWYYLSEQSNPVDIRMTRNENGRSGEFVAGEYTVVLFKHDYIPETSVDIVITKEAVKTETVAATCEKDGKTVVTYSDGTTEETIIPKLGHDYGDWSYNAGNRQHSKTCANDPAHVVTENCTFDEGVVKKEATETENGIMLYTCTVCGGTYEDVITTKTVVSEVVTKEATCEEAGELLVTYDDGSTTTKVIPPKGHAYGEWVHDAENHTHTKTCANDPKHVITGDCEYEDGTWNSGKLTKVCSVCKGEHSVTVLSTDKTEYKYGEPIMVTTNYAGAGAWVGLYKKGESYNPDAGGSYSIFWYYLSEQSNPVDLTKTRDENGRSGEFVAGAYTIVLFQDGGYTPYTSVDIVITKEAVKTETVDPTCEKDGKTIVTYSDGTTEVTVIPKLGHDWSDWEYNGADHKDHTRTCKRDASHTETENCSFDEGVVTKDPTQTEAGEKTYTCSVCEGTYTESYSDKEVDRTEVLKEATCTEDGTLRTYYKDGTYIDTVIVKKGHAWGDWVFDETTKSHTRTCGNDASHTESEPCVFALDSYGDNAAIYVCLTCGGSYRSPLLSTDKTVYEYGDPIMVTTDYNGGDMDWVGIYKKGETYDPNNGGKASIYWYYLYEESNPTNIIGTRDDNNRTGEFVAGEYTIVLFHNDSYEAVATVDITITKSEVSRSTIPATCEQDGKIVIMYSDGTQDITVLPKLGHAYGDWSYDAEKRQHVKVCGNDASHTVHEDCSFGEGEIIEEATESKHGVKKYTCSVCGGSYTEEYSILAVDHTEILKAATCEEAGTLRTYYVDGSYIDTVIPKLGHDWGDWTHIEDTKTHVRTCKHDETHTETADCTMGDPVVEGSSVAWTCTVCGGVYETGLLVTDKTNYQLGEAIMVTAFCNLDGSWVGLYGADETPGDEYSYHWFNVYNTDAGIDRVGAAINIANPELMEPGRGESLSNGEYKIILFGDQGYDNILATVYVTIFTDTSNNTYDIALNGVSYADGASVLYNEGTTVKMTVTGEGELGNGWVGIYPAIYEKEFDFSTLTSSYWHYIADHNGKAVNLNSQLDGMPAGSYTIVIFADGGWEDVRKVVYVKVEKEASNSVIITPPTCTEYGVEYVTYEDGTSAYRPIAPLGHDYGENPWIIDQEKHTHTNTCERCKKTITNDCSFNEEIIREATETRPGLKKYTCRICGLTYEAEYTLEEVKDTTVSRLYGDNRITTALGIADQLKDRLGLEKFSTIIIACATNYADALSGSYLAGVKDAPILLGWNGDTKYNYLNDEVVAYVRENLAEDGTVYILGGEKAVPASVDAALQAAGCANVKRLAGENRFETNLLILKEAGVTGGDILVCTGTGFADALSASAVDMPILMVYNELYDSQKEFLNSLNARKFYIIGGEKAVNFDIETILRGHAATMRIGGANRYETSVEIAKRLFEDPDTAVLAYAWDFPDGLCGGQLALSMGAPLILTGDPKVQTTASSTEAAAKYAQDCGISAGTVLGGQGLIADKAVRDIFRMEDGNNIVPISK